MVMMMMMDKIGDQYHLDITSMRLRVSCMLKIDVIERIEKQNDAGGQDIISMRKRRMNAL